MSKFLNYKKNQLTFNNFDLSKVAGKYKTPFYFYHQGILVENYQFFIEQARLHHIPNPLVCFALKSNPNPLLLQSLLKLGSGVDIVSGGELKLALKCGANAGQIVFSGVGKTKEEIKFALKLKKQPLYSFNVESEEELEMINYFAGKLKVVARIAFRLNPQVVAKTHKYISTGYKDHKFGMLGTDILRAIKQKKYWTHSKLVGASVHIGSQLTELAATKRALEEVSSLLLRSNPDFEFVDVGGGLGIPYHTDEKVAAISDYMNIVSKTLQKELWSKLTQPEKRRVVFEPGRVLIGQAGVLVMKVIRTKKGEQTTFVIADGAMNDLMRPSLYGAYHQILPLKKRNGKLTQVDIVGPVCESADCFLKGQKMVLPQSDDYLCIADTGAYGISMSSNYNVRKKPDEVILDIKGKIKVISHD
jgi:diaminopimelate decarboxylase